jgi:beta-glucanase (GH16 family)
VSTHGRFDQTYGRFAIRARFPAVRVPGLQTSLWLYPDDPRSGTRVPGRTPGEIDIAEEYSLLSTVAVPTFHYVFDRTTTDPATHINVSTAGNCAIGNLAAFHVYLLDWTPTTLRVSFDGRTCLVDHYRAEAPFTGSEPFDKPFDIELTQALGITTNAFTPGVTPLPATTSIDWVRVWK